MSSILDIDLDYFNLVDKPARRLKRLLKWADCHVSFVVEKHHKVLAKWKSRIKNGHLTEPQFILHVDEHHDMMDERSTPNIGNFIVHAMQIWPQVRVHWLVDQAIDTPEMWLSDETWGILSKRFTWGSHRPCNWPKPDLISVCTSPEFVSSRLCNDLLKLLG
jgi:hypothetical protein